MTLQVQFLFPSELVFFNAEKYASTKGVFNKISLLHTDVLVNRLELVQYLLAAAFLANEKAGLVRLELRKKRINFGLSSKMVLYADPTGLPSSWDGPCLEADLLEAADHSANSEAASIVSAWLGRNYSDPYDEVFERLKANLAERDLLDVQEERVLKVFISRNYSLPAENRAFIESQPLDSLDELLHDCQSSRPQVWQELLLQMRKAVDSRQEQMDVDG